MLWNFAHWSRHWDVIDGWKCINLVQLHPQQVRRISKRSPTNLREWLKNLGLKQPSRIHRNGSVRFVQTELNWSDWMSADWTGSEDRKEPVENGRKGTEGEALWATAATPPPSVGPVPSTVAHVDTSPCCLQKSLLFVSPLFFLSSFNVCLKSGTKPD